ncbi:CHAP domain-containing protein [Sphingobium sp. BYY-5]|uniref:CHAP domain-containing protein n=1 Tax=Sphingobium sp. BYY-5 TaxID=2926400 RepID=UPI001FA7DAAC|nr:CHAP domain-containing protein [Sphingobium sp. BYY-5]MCI4591337.1 CHAP domain-containing protein [Sphingobium sp. BYY-5]
MIGGFRTFFAASVLALTTLVAVPATAHTLQCVPFARQASGIQLFGNANTWWGQAEGHYDRGHEPRVGAVLAFSSSRAMPIGHVAMVSKVVNDREVLLTHANWSYRGGIERDVRAVDVSPNNDWTDVRVWYAPIGGLGLRSNPAKGFIYADAPKAIEQPVRIASADNAGGAALRAAF